MLKIITVDSYIGKIYSTSSTLIVYEHTSDPIQQILIWKEKSKIKFTFNEEH